MVIFRGALPADDFAIVANHWFRDPRLSGKAKGYMGYIATHDKGYRLTVEQLIAEMKESRDAVYAGLDELVTLDYLERVQGNALPNAKSTRKGFGEVDYHFGPAAYEQQYERNWGWNNDGTGACKTAGQRASGKSGNGRDQGKRGVPPGGSASGKSGSGKRGSANPDTKKIKDLEDQGLEDQENSPLPPEQSPLPTAELPSLSASDEPPAEPDVPAAGGEIDLDSQTRAAINAAVATAVALRSESSGWTVGAVRRAVRDALTAGHPAELVIATLAAFAADKTTRFPGRIKAYLDEKARQHATAPPPPVWAEPAVRYLDPDKPRCRQHPDQPETGCGPCKVDDKGPANSGPEMARADALALIRQTNAAAAAARKAAAANRASRGTAAPAVVRREQHSPGHISTTGSPATA